MAEIVYAVAGLGLAALLFGGLGIVATFPAWLVGRAAGHRRHDEIRGNFLIETRTRRWLLWSVLTLVFLVILSTVLGGSGTIDLVWLIPGFLALAGAEYAAFAIGYSRSSDARGRKETTEFANVGKAVIEHPRAEVADFAPPTGSYPRARAGTPPASSLAEDQAAAEREGYRPAEPSPDQG